MPCLTHEALINYERNYDGTGTNIVQRLRNARGAPIDGQNMRVLVHTHITTRQSPEQHASKRKTGPRGLRNESSTKCIDVHLIQLLCCDHGSINASHGYELIVSALLNDTTTIKHEDAICILHTR